MRAALATAETFPGATIATEKLRGVMLWLMGCAGAFVFVEPSPYEVVGVLTMTVFVVTGLTLSARLTPLVILLVILNIGYATALIAVADQDRPVTWVGVSAFLGLTAIFYAAMLGRNTQMRLTWLMRGYLAAAVIASTAGIAGYVHITEGLSDLFLRYGRARGTFNDPNVLGAFLLLPGLLLVQRVLAGRSAQALWSGMLLTIVMGGLFLSFSRAAWGIFALCAMILMALTFVTSRSAKERLRIVAIAIMGVVLLAVALAALLSIGNVADLFKERATLDQSYDLGHLGRFGRYILGANLALENPLGLGPMQFYKFFREDPHNTFLNSFMSGGWLAGCAYATLTFVTMISGLRFLFVATPWRPVYQAIYVAYLGIVIESAVIDIDHWRHYFLILGVLWGLMAATRRYCDGRGAGDEDGSSRALAFPGPSAA